MSPATWRYEVRVEGAGGGWALVILTADGFFGAASDWGGYAFRWPAAGPDFRRFIVGMDWGYLESKLSPGYPISQNLKRQLRAFCKAALPRLQEMIREELAAEGAQP